MLKTRKLFREYAQTSSRGDVYEAYSECFWLWYIGKKSECDAVARKFFKIFHDRERSASEQIALRALINVWMRVMSHVDGKKVKWSRR